MITGTVMRRAEELRAHGEPFVVATVVRVQKPTSAQPGNAAVVREDGTIEGFVGGVCAAHSVRLYSLKAIETGEPVLLRILPDGAGTPNGSEPLAGYELDSEEGAVSVKNPCLSGGSIEVFLEPVLPSPRVVVVGESPIAVALARLGPELGLEIAGTVDGDPGGPGEPPAPGGPGGPGRPGEPPAPGGPVPRAGDLGLVVAAHGGDEPAILRAGLQAGVEYVGLVASRKRGAAVIEELRSLGVPEEQLAMIDSPAGLEIGARTPAEVALSILAQIVSVRRRGGPSAHPPSAHPEQAAHPRAGRVTVPATAVDPICGMEIVIAPDTPTATEGGEAFYFCCEGCRRTFESRHA